VWTVYGLHVTGCQLLCIARTLLVMWVVWCTRAYSVVEDVWSWTSWVGIGALVRAPAPIAHSLRHLFVHLLPGPCGHVALHIAVHCPSFLSLLPLGALPGWCGMRARMELELFDRAVGATGACGCPPPLRRACAPGRAGPAGTGTYQTQAGGGAPSGARPVQCTGIKTGRNSRRRGNLGLLMCVRR